MHNMGNPLGTAIWKAGRAEFFSMITVMIGMGLVIRFVTPSVVGYSPDPPPAPLFGDLPPWGCWWDSFSPSL
jgi:hypothetical protein